jgi:hypothetical protein
MERSMRRTAFALSLLALSICGGSGVAHAEDFTSPAYWQQVMYSAAMEHASDAANERHIQARVAAIGDKYDWMSPHERALRMRAEETVLRRNLADAQRASGNPRFRNR